MNVISDSSSSIPNIQIIGVEDIKIRGAGPYLYKCRFCEKPYKSYTGCAVHEVKVHTEEHIRVECPVCNKKFINETMWRSHMRKHDRLINSDINNIDNINNVNINNIDINNENDILREKYFEKINEIQKDFRPMTKIELEKMNLYGIKNGLIV